MEQIPKRLVISSEYVDDEEDEYYIRDTDGRTKQVTKEEYEGFLKAQEAKKKEGCAELEPNKDEHEIPTGA